MGRIASSLLLLLLAACAGTTERHAGADGSGVYGPAVHESAVYGPAVHGSAMYQGLGERAGIEAIVDDLLEYIVYDDRINHYFVDTDLVRFREKLIDQVCAEAGGPCTYTGEPMAPVHAGRGIDEAAFNALVEDLIAAMDDNAIPVRVQNRLLQRLAPMHREIVDP